MSIYGYYHGYRKRRLGLGLATASALTTLALSGVGTASGSAFTALSEVDGYSASAGRHRLTANGFTPCAANEARLCYDTNGDFLGQAMEPGGTYYAPPMNDKAASTANGQPGYFRTFSLSGDTVETPGQHTQADILGSTGHGVYIQQGSSTAARARYDSLGQPITAGQFFCVAALVTVEHNAAGTIGLRNDRGRSLQVDFTHDAAGNITGVAESWGTYKANYFNLPWLINGKKVALLWLMTDATSTSTLAPGIAWPGPATGRTIHFHAIRTQVADDHTDLNFPSMFPMFGAGEVVFADDTLDTSFSTQFGYITRDTSCSRIEGGEITIPRGLFGTGYRAIETAIRVADAGASTQRSGLNHTGNEGFYFQPWKASAQSIERFAGASAFPNELPTSQVNRNVLGYAVKPVFDEKPELWPWVHQASTSSGTIGGPLGMSKLIIFAANDTAENFWQQGDFSATSRQLLQGTGGVDVQHSIFAGVPYRYTRTRDYEQEDAAYDSDNYIAEVTLQTSGSGTINADDIRGIGIGRMQYSALARADAVTLLQSRQDLDLFWSDFNFTGQGTHTITNSDCAHGRVTSDDAMDFYQSRREIEVSSDGGASWQSLSASGKTVDNLPYGRRATKTADWNFDTNTETPNADATLVAYLRYWNLSNGTFADKPGFQLNMSQIDVGGAYSRRGQVGEVFVASGIDRVTGQPIAVKFTVDLGEYTDASTYVPDTDPALPSSGTHADNGQDTQRNCTIVTRVRERNFYFNKGQGTLQQGLGGGGTDSSTYGTQSTTDNVWVLDATNAARTENSRDATTTSVSRFIALQAASKFRFTDGSARGLRIIANGAGDTINLGVNVVMATAHPTGIGNTQAGGTITGTVTTVECPTITNFDQVEDLTGVDPVLADLIAPEFLDAPSGRVKLKGVNWRDFRVTALAETLAGFGVNGVIAANVTRQAAKDPVYDEWKETFIDPALTFVEVPDDTAVGATLVSGVAASDWHWKHGAARDEFFVFDGNDIKLGKPLTGLDFMHTCVDAGGNPYCFNVRAA